MTNFSDYQPHGESLTFTRTFLDDVASPEALFADALRVCDHLANVVRPSGFDVWFTCVIEGTTIRVNEPEPSEQFWELLQQETPATVNEPVPSVIKRYPALTDGALKEAYRQALDTVTCPPGFFVMFENITPLHVSTRLGYTSVSPNTQTLPVTLWDDTLNLPVSTDADGTAWLAPLPEHAAYLPPVTFRIWYDSVLILTLDVNWSRWLQEGSGEHALLQSALNSLVADDWRPQASGSRHFKLGRDEQGPKPAPDSPITRDNPTGVNMTNLRFYFKLSDIRPEPAAVMRQYEVNGITRSESYRFNRQVWDATEFFDKYRLGHNDNDFIEVSEAEAEEAIATIKRRTAEGWRR